jgi:hypothetical protein
MLYGYIYYPLLLTYPIQREKSWFKYPYCEIKEGKDEYLEKWYF